MAEVKLEPCILAAWQELIERDDRTSPEEYPEMALITRDELAEFMRRAIPPHDALVKALREAIDAMDYVPLAGPQTEQDLITRLETRSAEYGFSYIRAAVERACREHMKAVLTNHGAGDDKQ